jgi:hypothetical protein
MLRLLSGVVAVSLCFSNWILLQAQQAKVSGPADPVAIPQLTDITAKTGIHFTHLSSPEKKYIVESMSGGVALIFYQRA